MKNKGFTLVELAIVIVIIGLLVGGVLQGQELIKQSQIRRAVVDLRGYDTAIVIFKDKYKFLPGDFRGTTVFSGTADGNQDGQIASAGVEKPLAWQHLSLAKLIKGSFTGVGEAAKPIVGTNSPGTAFNGTTIVARYAGNFNAYPKNQLEFGGLYATAYYAAEAAFTPDEARQMDEKIDDGFANRGILVGVDGSSSPANSCSAPYTTAGGADYNLANSAVTCRLFYALSAN